MAKVIVAIIAIPFVLFGVDAFFTGGVPKVAEVNGEEITAPDLQQEIELQRRRLLAQAGDDVDSGLFEDSALRGPVLENLINRELLEQVARKSGMVSPAQLVDAVILADPSFQEEGTFSAARYENLLRSSGMSPAMYRRRLARDLLLQQVTAGLVNSAFVTEAEMQIAARIVMQTRDIRYLTLPAATGTDVAVPTDDEIRVRFEAQSERFVTDETVDVEYLELRLDALKTSVDEAAVRAEYERRKRDYVASVERHAAHILIETREDVDDRTAKAELMGIKSRLDEGESFEALAREFSDDVGSAANGGDLGISRGDVFPKQFEEALAALEPGQVSDPVQTDAGWHLIKLISVRGGEVPTFEQVRAEIESTLARTQAEQRFVELSEDLADLTFNADDLEAASRELGLPVQRVSGVSREQGEGLFSDPRLRRSAFSDDVLVQRLNSQPVELASDHIVVLRVTGHEPARPKELSEVRDQLFEELLAERKREFLEQRSHALIASLQAGQSIEELAREQNLDWQVALAASRTDTTVPTQIITEAFKLARPAPGERSFSTASMSDGGLSIIEVTNAVDGRLDEMSEPDRKQLRAAMQQSRAQQLLSAYRNSLRRSAEIELF